MSIPNIYPRCLTPVPRFGAVIRDPVVENQNLVTMQRYTTGQLVTVLTQLYPEVESIEENAAKISSIAVDYIDFNEWVDPLLPPELVPMRCIYLSPGIASWDEANNLVIGEHHNEESREINARFLTFLARHFPFRLNVESLPFLIPVDDPAAVRRILGLKQLPEHFPIIGWDHPVVLQGAEWKSKSEECGVMARVYEKAAEQAKENMENFFQEQAYREGAFSSEAVDMIIAMRRQRYIEAQESRTSYAKEQSAYLMKLRSFIDEIFPMRTQAMVETLQQEIDQVTVAGLAHVDPRQSGTDSRRNLGLLFATLDAQKAAVIIPFVINES